MLVRDVMTTAVVTARPDMRVKQAIELLHQHQVTALPVVDGEGCLVGVLSEADVLRGAVMPDRRTREIPVRTDGRISPLLVSDVMTAHPMSVAADADLAAAATVLVDTQVKSLPVVEGEQVVGVVSRRDVIAVLARSDTLIESELDELLRAAEIEAVVDVVDGVARLDGPTEPHAREIARVLAGTVPGVVGIVFV